MRVALVFVLAVAASALSLSDRDSLNARLAQVSTKSAFGQNVLQELQAKINAGSPIDELKAILTEIRDRLTDAQTADDAQHANHQASCASDLAGYDADIDTLNGEISDLKQNIENTEGAISDGKDDIITQENTVHEQKVVIKNREQEIADLKAQRDLDHRIFTNRTRDTVECMDAIDSIKEVEGLDLVKARENETSSDYNEAYYDKTPAAVFLQKLQTIASKTQDETAKNLILLASVAAAGLDKGDVKDLLSLLDRLKDELVAYKKNLADVEAEQIAEFRAQLAVLEGLLADDNERLVSVETKLANLNSELQSNQKKLQGLNTALADQEQRLADTTHIRKTVDNKCQDLATAHENRTTDRNEEFDTLDQIMAIIKDKLEGYGSQDDQHLADRTSGVSVRS